MSIEFLFSHACETLNIPINKILHVGAHLAEELKYYEDVLNVSKDDVLWIDAIQENIDALREAGIPNCHQAVLDRIERETEFTITSFTQSSSLYNLKDHLKYYPDVVPAIKRVVQTETLDSFFKRVNAIPHEYNVWMFDIQGGEFPVLESSTHLLQHVDILQTEISTEELYEGIRLLPDLDRFLEANGFKRLHLVMTPNGWGDAIYVKKKFLNGEPK